MVSTDAFRIYLNCCKSLCCIYLLCVLVYFKTNRTVTDIFRSFFSDWKKVKFLISITVMNISKRIEPVKSCFLRWIHNQSHFASPSMYFPTCLCPLMLRVVFWKVFLPRTGHRCKITCALLWCVDVIQRGASSWCRATARLAENNLSTSVCITLAKI